MLLCIRYPILNDIGLFRLPYKSDSMPNDDIDQQWACHKKI